MNYYLLSVKNKQERTAQSAIQALGRTIDLGEEIGDILLPTTPSGNPHHGGSERTAFPGYLLVRLELNDELQRAITAIPAVNQFVGTTDDQTGQLRPIPLDQHEIEEITENTATLPPLPYKVGDPVTIVSGSFQDMSSTVHHIDPAADRVTLHLNLFGRNTPVTLSSHQLVKT